MSLENEYFWSEQRGKDYNRIMEDLNSLIEVVENDGDVDYSDYAKLLQIRTFVLQNDIEMLKTLRVLQLCYKMENEKDRFEVQKLLSESEKELVCAIQGDIKVSRTWKMEDYRCQGFMRRMEEYYVDLLDYIEEEDDEEE